MPAPSGFDFSVHAAEVRITHHGQRATTLRGAAAAKFLASVESEDRQELMARATGNYERGNERVGRNHPRNAR